MPSKKFLVTLIRICSRRYSTRSFRSRHIPKRFYHKKPSLYALYKRKFSSSLDGDLVSNTAVLSKFMNLPINKVQAEYIWVGGEGFDFRCKSRVFETGQIKQLSDLPNWTYDGSSTNQATQKFSEVLLRPVRIAKDPIRGGENILVLCESLDPTTGKSVQGSQRQFAEKIFSNQKVIDEEPWFGIEQEYTILDGKSRRPFLWPPFGFPAAQGQYYCATGGGNTFGRDIVEAHYRACIYAGLQISGINAEVMPSQWEYQVGPCLGIDGADQLMLARWLMQRIAEEFGAFVTLKPKPVPGDWNGTGAHTNFSTKSMRNDGGYQVILKAMEKLAENHLEHMTIYGGGNKERMTGKHETAKWDEFTWAVGNRGVSVRIHTDTEKNGKGFFEDRRPAANMDPYMVTAKLCETCIL